MKIDSPIRISFFVGLILSFLCLLLFNLFTDYGSFFIRVLVFIVLSVLLLYYILNKLFYEKIRVIHKNIYKFKGTSSVKYLDIGNVTNWILNIITKSWVWYSFNLDHTVTKYNIYNTSGLLFYFGCNLWWLSIFVWFLFF